MITPSPKLLVLLLTLPFAKLTAAQNFRNLNFSQLCDSSKTGICYWDLSWGKNAVKPAHVDGFNALSIQGNTVQSVGFAEQSSSFNRNDPAIIEISAFVKTDSIEGKGAGLNLGLYDADGLLLATKDMGGYYSIDWIRGTTNWKKYSVSIVAPAGTRKVKTGAILYGKGKAWFRDYSVKTFGLANRRPSKLATGFISAAIDTIKKHSLVRDSVDYKKLKATALSIAGNAKSYGDCYLAISYLLESLRPFGDHHSFFMKADEVKTWESEGSQVNRIEWPELKKINDYGYIKVPAFHGGNKKQMLDFADSLQRGIKLLDGSAIKGWIVDLRENTGGNMAPMIAGLGPLFTGEKLGSLVDVNGRPNSWYYKEGKYYWDDEAGWSVTSPVSLAKKLPIAVLVSNQTGSSGEAVVVSFIGNANSILVGTATWGLTTGNGSFSLKDGSQIFLASTVYADRNGRLYHGSIEPDIPVSKMPGDKKIPQEAFDWLEKIRGKK